MSGVEAESDITGWYLLLVPIIFIAIIIFGIIMYVIKLKIAKRVLKG